MTAGIGECAAGIVAPGRPTRGRRALLIEGGRNRRVLFLIAGIVLLGLFDLGCTLTYMRHAGMIELNPLATAMVSIAGERQLILFKLFTLNMSVGILYFMRRHRIAELGAWICVAAMAMLTFHWLRYNDKVVELTNEYAVLAMAETTPGWVRFAD